MAAYHLFFAMSKLTSKHHLSCIFTISIIRRQGGKHPKGYLRLDCQIQKLGEEQKGRKSINKACHLSVNHACYGFPECHEELS